eukprot:TRINITY_DN5002_c0_g1_i1.p1 TRINITY_DN5002_c0_g1~~TRINITY_DN5002_c0_g1_i1.p1  ORF type:complete len:660 (-),score=142.63 TRINITY_DN5002_c0_g1_i1:206-2185(-)
MFDTKSWDKIYQQELQKRAGKNTTSGEGTGLLGESEFVEQFEVQDGDSSGDSNDESNISLKKLWKKDKSAFFKRLLKLSPYYVLPISTWLPEYSWKNNIVDDIIAGVGVACMLIPQGLAYALLAGVPPIMGLYTAWMPVIIYALMGTSRHVAFGPDALGSLLVGLMLKKTSEMDIDPVLQASAYAFFCGLIALFMGIFSFGFLDSILSRPLLAGFVNAVAVIILVRQLHPFFGLPKPGEDITEAWEIVEDFFHKLHYINWTTFSIGIFCLVLLFGLRIVKTNFPEWKFMKFVIGNLVVVVWGILFGYFTDINVTQGVALLGEVPNVFPVPRVPSLDLQSVNANFYDALIMTIIGFVETIVACKIYASKHSYRISPNRELVAMGLANFIGSFFQTFPTFGSLPRSAMADSLNARSQLYNLIASVFVLVSILYLDILFYYLPRVVMSSILIVAAIALLELEDLHFLWSIRAYKEVFLMAAIFILTIFLGVDLGIFIGIGVSLFMVVRHSSTPHISIMGKSADGSWSDVTTDSNSKLIPGTLVVSIDESLYFANIDQVKDMFKRIQFYGSHLVHPGEKRTDVEPLQNIIIRANGITDIDASAIQTLWQMLEEYEKDHIFVSFVGLRPTIKVKFVHAGLIGALGGDRLFDTIEDALQYTRKDK